MRRLALFVLLACLIGTSIAEARQSTLALSCGQAEALVAARGAIVLTTGEHTYNRFVVHGGFCVHGEVARPAYAPTLDTPNCPVGYTCEYRSRKLGFD